MNEQSATLQRAMDVLNSICLKPHRTIEPAPVCESQKPGGVSPDFRPSSRIAANNGIPPHDPAEWRELFARWLGSVCVHDPRCWGGVGSLHVAFCEWAIAQDDVPCVRFTFECLLRELGFAIDEIAGAVLVNGLTFREDFESAGLRPKGAARII